MDRQLIDICMNASGSVPDLCNCNYLCFIFCLTSPCTRLAACDWHITGHAVPSTNIIRSLIKMCARLCECVLEWRPVSKSIHIGWPVADLFVYAGDRVRLFTCCQLCLHSTPFNRLTTSRFILPLRSQRARLVNLFDV